MNLPTIMTLGTIVVAGVTVTLIVYGIHLALRPVPEPPQPECKAMDEATTIAYACWPVEVQP
jgi:hypothetical protein